LPGGPVSHGEECRRRSSGLGHSASRPGVLQDNLPASCCHTLPVIPQLKPRGWIRLTTSLAT